MEAEVNDIHNFSLRMKRVEDKIRNERKISSDNKIRILKFIEFMKANGLKPPSIVKDVYAIWFISVALGKTKFENATKDDFVKVVSKIEDKSWSEWTKRNHKIALKKFMKWVKGLDERGVYPPEVRWIGTGLKAMKGKLPEELLSEDDILKMLNVTSNPRDKAILSTLFETGCRVGELLNMKIKHVVFEKKDLAFLMLNGKTGMRRIPVISCAPSLATWLNNHPFKNNPESFLWITNKRYSGIDRKEVENGYVPLSYQGVKKLIIKTVIKAGIKKRVYAHLFRHSSATISSKFLSESQMKEYFGWTRGSMMPGVYIHLSQKDVLDGKLKMHGRLPEIEKAPKTTPRQCPRCNQMNSAESKFCSGCGLILDMETAKRIQVEELKNKEYMESEKTNKQEFFQWLMEKYYPVYENEMKKK